MNLAIRILLSGHFNKVEAPPEDFLPLRIAHLHFETKTQQMLDECFPAIRISSDFSCNVVN